MGNVHPIIHSHDSIAVGSGTQEAMPVKRVPFRL
jgi:hypothetical protein